ncbi:MAG: HAD-IB family phosphatase [Desulfovibrio sp.]|jgi:HAD superfamily phosphoserine phosphatase-like hydrolase|nr:HAD-IB family phosphatase [Desulfovibrio sp.]
MIRFIFDLDGTVSAEETLPLIASHFRIEEEIAVLTRETIAGNIPFTDSFIKRVHILSRLPVPEVRELLAGVRLFSGVLDFLANNSENCVIATGNLDCWAQGLLNRTGIRSYTSSALVRDDRVQKITKILRKEDVVKQYKAQGDTVVFIGEGNNDMEAMRLADVSIASALVHTPANSVLSITDYLVFEEDSLCRLLNQLS